MKKDFKAWAVKLRGRSFALDHNGHPLMFKAEVSARQYAWSLSHESAPNPIKAEHIRVKIRIEETT